MAETPPLLVLYGGTFDPVHNGHLAVAEAAAERLQTDVWMLPSADPPLRAPPGASAEQRAAMLDLAVEHLPNLHVDRRELGRPGPSYTVDTLAEVRAGIGEAAPLAWILGADAFRDLCRWHRWQDLFGLAHLVVAARPGYATERFDAPLEAEVATRWTSDPDALADRPCGLVMRLDLRLRPEAASALRADVAAGRHWEHETPPAVVGYIRKYGLYAH